jgi:hypothetical protein
MADLGRCLLGRHLHQDVLQGLAAQRPGPPQRRSLDGDGPLDVVAAGGQGLGQMVVDVADRAAHHHGAGLGRLEVGPEDHHRPLGGGLAAQHAEVADADRAGLLDPHRSPDAAGVPGVVEAVPVLEDAGEVPLRRPVALGRAGDLDRQRVLGARRERLGDLEGVRGEVALGVAEVGAVEPEVGLVEEPVEGEPQAAAVGRPRVLEPVPVQQRPVAVDEGGIGAPVGGDGDRLPPVVVEPGLGVGPPQLVVGERCTPGAPEVHDRGRVVAAPAA